jgi:hypothetical protein
MEPVIEPEPTPAERQALKQAVDAVAAVPSQRPSAWWQAGLEENLGGDAAAPAWPRPPD